MALADAPLSAAIESVATVGAGLQRVSADQHDVYLIDQQLPDGTGVDLIQAAKAHGAHKPFILLTGYGSAGLDEEASRQGAADYVEKHMVGAHLERTIRYALRNWQASRALHEREEQLRHAQKMEAIGRLAGGVAHDFNNILTAIIGYTDLIAERLDPDDATAHDVAEIRHAADRAAGFTRQLLSFSRKQFLNPKVLNLNEIVSGMLEMLPRVIGDHIETSMHLDRQLARTRADASQMEQVLVNLVLNARDAMPMGGRLTIETSMTTLGTDALAAQNLRLPPGEYVVLAVADTGTGMDVATRERAFEPFFTTKPKGKGTGLGLATVYGIIDQSGGAIHLDSTPGEGTTVRIYLPVTSVSDEPPAPPVAPIAHGGGNETVLLVEDHDSVRDLAARALRRRGYTVYEARNAEEAIEWCATSGVTPHLLVTDVVMPGLGGPNLAARLVHDMPQLRVLYMSGYTGDSSADRAFWGDVPLLQKPFTPAKLAECVRLALDIPLSHA
jgi:signal transduction histidine kinase